MSTQPFPLPRQMQCKQAPPRSGTEMLHRGARTMSTPPKYPSTASAHTAPYRTPDTTINDSRSLNSSCIPISNERISAPSHASLCPDNWRGAGRVAAGVLTDPLAVDLHRVEGASPAGLCGHVMEEAYHGGGYAAVPAAVARGQPRGETARDRIIRGVEHVGPRTRMRHESGNYCRIVTDFSDTFNTVKRT